MEEAGSLRPDISVVIVTWNQRRLLQNCIESVRASARSCSTEILVVDNASSDGTSDYARSLPDVGYHRNSSNLGVARARNVGTGLARGRYILHLDDDTEMHPDCIPNLLRALDADPEVWLAGCRLLNTDGTLQYSCRRFYTPLAVLARRTPLGRTPAGRRAERRHLMADWDHGATRTVDWVVGAAYCMRVEAVEKIGDFYSGFFFGFEDVDWAYRVWQGGGKVLYVHDAVVTHHWQRSSRRVFSRRMFNHLASLFQYWRRNGMGRPASH